MLRLAGLISMSLLTCAVPALAAGDGGAGEPLPLSDYVDETTYTVQHAGAPRTLSIRQLLDDLPAHRWDYVVVGGELTTVQVVDLKVSFCHYADGALDRGQLTTVSINALRPYLAYLSDHLGDCCDPGDTPGAPVSPPSTPGSPVVGAVEWSDREAPDREAQQHEERDREGQRHEERDREARSDVADREGRGERDNRD